MQMIKKDDKYLGMHNGTVKGKGFEGSRRNRKSHAERRAEIVSRSSGRPSVGRK